MANELTKKAGKGVFWNITAQFFQQIIKFFTILVLARLLSPGDFGLFSMVLVFTDIISPLREWGFQAALIYKKDIDEEYRSTAFWSICLVALALYLLSVISARFVGAFFHNPVVSRIIPVVSIGILLSPIGSIQWAMLMRDLKIRPIAIRNIFAEIMYGATACILALNNFGVWSFVAGNIVRELTWSMILWTSYKWRPLFVFNIRKFKEIVSYGADCMGISVLNAMITNIDNVIVGKFFGAIKLGFYNLAFNTVSHPHTKLAAQVSSVTFPAFSIIQDDIDRVQNAYRNATKAIMMLAIPFLSVLFVSAKEFVTVFYGSKWLLATPLIQIMCFYGFIQAALSPTSSVFLSKGKTGSLLKINFVRLVLLFSILIFGVRYGINGVAASLLLYSIIMGFLIFYFVSKLLSMRPIKFYFVILRYAAIYFLLSGAIWLSSRLLLQHYEVTPLCGLTINFGIGMVIYPGLMLLFARKDLFTAFALAKKISNK